MAWPLWIGFLLAILLLISLDLGVFNRTPKALTAAQALRWTALWVTLSLLFSVLVYFIYENHWFDMGLGPNQARSGRQAMMEFLTGYIVEESLSLDNIFVMAIIFSYFRVPAEFQHRVLFWGILGALILRGIMIGAGLGLIAAFSWITYVFGGILLLTAAKMLFVQGDGIEPEKNPLIRLVKRFYPITDGFRGTHFFVIENGRRMATPMALTLVVVESSDVIFAVDSIPAVFAVTRDPFLVFTSNVCAILGLRSLYFALAAILDRFRYLKYSLVFLLAFVGVKMILAHHYPVPTGLSLALIITALAAGIVFSLMRDPPPPAPPPAG